MSALNQLNSLAPAAHIVDGNGNICYHPIPTISSSTGASSSKIERAPFTVHVPTRQLRRCPSIPPSSVDINAITTKPKKYIPIDTTPYTTISSSLPHHPPPRPPRPPSAGFNSLAGPDEILNNSHHNTATSQRHTFDVNINRNKNDPSQNNSPPILPPANYRKRHSQNRLSRSIPTKSNQALQQQQQDLSVHPLQSAPHILPHDGDDEDDDEDEDEPLALTLSRQQSFRQRQTRSQIMHQQHQRQQQQQQQPAMPTCNSKGVLAPSGSIGQLSVDNRSQLQCYEQVTPATSSESVTINY
ncbi:hypothetical protein BGZ96_009009 [Linnemannia gamsii]|uniref:Uncharacterized protein n=1 Tax=Linnemannia gamsii TaxID=64522 RepID=A0ABQ7JXN9_9FUNG|nr:hypothetical protein BGZ96_009009 [Linnemannia gamsii]